MRAASILAAIEAHRLAVIRDEALYDAQGNPIAGEDAMRASDEEIAARFLDFASTPCRTHDDVQCKVDYVLNGAAGLREADGWQGEFIASLTGTGDETCIGAEGGPLVRFLRSLQIEPAPDPLTAATSEQAGGRRPDVAAATPAEVGAASREALAVVERMGRDAARAIMVHATTYLTEPDEMEAMVDRSCHEFSDLLSLGGISDRDHAIAVPQYRHALVTEGGRISRSLEWEGGTA